MSRDTCETCRYWERILDTGVGHCGIEEVITNEDSDCICNAYLTPIRRCEG